MPKISSLALENQTGPGCGMLWFQNLQIGLSRVSLMPQYDMTPVPGETALVHSKLSPYCIFSIVPVCLKKQTSQTLFARFQSLQDPRCFLPATGQARSAHRFGWSATVQRLRTRRAEFVKDSSVSRETLSASWRRFCDGNATRCREISYALLVRISPAIGADYRGQFIFRFGVKFSPPCQWNCLER